MFDALKFMRENRWTSFMLLFLVFLYAVLFFTAVFSKTHGLSSAPDGTVTASELKQKETAARENLLARPGLAAALSFVFFAVLCAGVALDVYLLLKGFRSRPWEAPFSEKARPLWGLRDVLQVFVFLFFVEGLIFIAQAFWYWATGLEKLPEDIFLLGNTVLRDICVTLFIWMLVRFRGQSMKDLGLRGGNFLRHVRTGLLGYVAIVPPMLVSFVLLAAVMQFFSYEPVPQNVVLIYLKKNTSAYLFIFTLFVAMIGPLLEEIFFRGFAYPALKKRFGTVRAMVAVAAVFAGFHMSLTAFLPIFLLGLFLTYLYESTGSLVPSMTVHVLHNTLMVLMTLGFRALAGPA